MLSPKSTIYQNGWLDLVFENRNKAYGAYELRQNYNKRLGRSLFFSSLFVLVLTAYPLLKQHFSKTGVADRSIQHKSDTTEVEISKIIQPPPKRQPQQPVAPPVQSLASEPLRTIQHIQPVAVNRPVVADPPTIDQINTSVISTQTTEGAVANPGVNGTSGIQTGTDSGIASGTGADEGLYTTEDLQRLPEFPGGMEAFAKFLRKNLRYPSGAIEAGVSGKVFVSFVVEKDGRLTDIKILRGIGYGCDEEAARVLKKSPAWKPGIQNNNEVRVYYTIPLSFQME